MAVRLQRREANTAKSKRHEVNHPGLPETFGGDPTRRSPTIGPASNAPDRKVDGVITCLSHRHGGAGVCHTSDCAIAVDVTRAVA